MKTDPYAVHEVFHMSLYLAEQIESQLCENPVIIPRPEWYELANEAAEKLHALYQAIGREHV